MARIIISAGHTNKDPGTVVSGIREVDLTRKIAKEVVALLRAENFVTLSVPPELDLARRIAWINQTGYSEANKDISIEIHINDGGKKGIEGWHQADKIDSQNLTNDILNETMKVTGWPSQGNKSEYEHPLGSLAFLHNTNPIASLVECGYLDNPEDLEFFKSEANIKKLAQGIVNGVKKFLGVGTIIKQTKQKPQDISIQTPNTPVPQKTVPAVIGSTPANQVPVATTPSPSPSPSTTFSSQPGGTFNQTSPGSFGGVGGMGGMSSMGGMGGGISSFGGGAGMSGMPIAGGAPGAGGYMSRDQRRDMIKNNYIKILGREPNQSDLNYFLNIGITEEQLIRKMVDSQEHVDLVKSRQEVIQTKKRFIEQRNEILRLKAKVNDQRGILKNLNALLMQKNNSIHVLQKKINSTTTNKKPVKNKKKQQPKYPKSFQERLLDYFSKKLG